MPQINIRWADNTSALVKNLREGLDVIDATKASADKMVRSLSGENLLRSAANYAAAINQIGGAQKLTASNQERVNAVMKKAVEQLEAAGRGSSDLANHYRDLAKQTEQVSKTGSGLSKWASDFTSNVAQMAAGWLTAKAVIGGIEGTLSAAESEIEHLVMTGSAISDVSSNFEVLATKAGLVGSALVGALREGTHGTINDFELMKTATQDLAAGMNLTDKQFGTLAKGAFALAQATGTDVKTALDTMNDAMLTGRTRALALLTGKINLSAGEEKLAKDLQSTAEHLTEEGKLEAARAAILESVSVATGRLGDQIDGLDENVAQIQASWQNFNNALAQSVAESPVLAAAFQSIAEAITGAVGSNQEDLVHNLTEAINQAALKIPDFIDFIVQLGVEAARVFDGIERRAGSVGAALRHIAVGTSAGAALGSLAGGVGAGPGAVIGAGVGAFMPVGTTDTGPTEALQAVEAAAKKTSEMTALMRQRMTEALDTSKKFVGPLQDVAAAQGKAGAAAGQHGDMLKKTTAEIAKETEAANALKAANSSMDELSGAQVEAIRFFTAQGDSASEVAKKLEIYEHQVRQVVEADKARLAASTQLATFQKNQQKQQSDLLKDSSQDVLSNLKVQTAAEKSHWDSVAKLTLTGVQYDLAQVDQWEAEEKSKLDKRSINYKAAEAAIVQAANDRRDEIRRLAELEDVKVKYEFVGPETGGPSSGPTIGSQLLQSLRADLKSAPDVVVGALMGGGGLEGAGKALGSKLGSDLTESWAEKIQTQLPGRLGAAIGSIVGPLGALIGPLLGKLFTIGGPSKQELEGRQVVADFEKDYANTADMINKVGEAYVANGKTAAQAQAAIQKLWAAEKQGADATKRALEEINAELQHHKEVTDAIDSQGFQSQDQIRHAADIANQAYEEMLQSSGQYTQAQIDQAYHHYQELLAQLDGAAGEAARAWLKIHDAAGQASDASSDAMKSAEADLKALIDKRNSLAQGIAAEAPEEVMGVIEQQQRGQLAALDKEIKDKADAYAKLADETGQKMADAIVEALKNIHIDPVHVPVIVDNPNTGINGGGRPGSGESPEADPGVNDSAPVSRGGKVTPTGVRYFRDGYIPMPNFRPIGTDIIPAMLTPGEMVLTASQQSAIGALVATGGWRGGSEGGTPGGGGSTTNNYVTIQATDAPSFERLVRERGVKVVVDQIVLGKDGHRENLKRGLNG